MCRATRSDLWCACSRDDLQVTRVDEAAEGDDRRDREPGASARSGSALGSRAGGVQVVHDEDPRPALLAPAPRCGEEAVRGREEVAETPRAPVEERGIDVQPGALRWSRSTRPAAGVADDARQRVHTAPRGPPCAGRGDGGDHGDARAGAVHLVGLGREEIHQELGEEPSEPLAGDCADELARCRLVGDEMTVDLAASQSEAHRAHLDEIAAELAPHDLTAVAVAKARWRACQAYCARPVVDGVVSLALSHAAARYERAVLPTALPPATAPLASRSGVWTPASLARCTRSAWIAPEDQRRAGADRPVSRSWSVRARIFSAATADRSRLERV